ncbi:hypothetical protein ES703_53381 [subsurface metagenome]
MEKLIFRACTRRLDVRIVAYTKECLRQSSHTELQYSITPTLQHLLERYVQAKPIDSDHAQRTWISESN